MDSKIVLLTVLGMALVTYIPRLLPIAVLTKTEAPKIFITWLKYVPVAVLGALLAPGLFIVDKSLNISFSNAALLASIPCFLISYRYKNMFATIITGVLTISLLSYFIS